MLHPIRGEFEDADLEHRFLEEAGPDLRQRALITSGCLTAAWIGMTLLDPWAADGVYVPAITGLRFLALAVIAGVSHRVWGGDVHTLRRWGPLLVLTVSTSWIGVAWLNQIEQNGRILQVALLIFGLGLNTGFSSRLLLLLTVGIAVPHYAFHLWSGGDHAAMSAIWLMAVTGVSMGLHQAMGNANRLSHLAKWRLADTVTAREHLVAAMGHELRSPLGTIRFIASLLREQEPAEQGPWLDRIDAQIVTLNDSVLAVMRLGSLSSEEPVARPDRVEAAALWTSVDQELSAVAPRAERHHEGGPGALFADRELLRSALRNLLANALRYAETEVRTQVQVVDGICTFSIDDDGPGVPAEAREQIFEPVVRSERGRAVDPQGIGLGLAVTRRVARAHGGTVQVSDSPLGGARFVLRIPTGIDRRSEAQDEA